MITQNILISNIEAARAFVAMTAKYPGIKIMLKAEDYAIDAHSIIGILSLDLSKPIELEADGDISKSFYDDLKPYQI